MTIFRYKVDVCAERDNIKEIDFCNDDCDEGSVMVITFGDGMKVKYVYKIKENL